MSDGETLAAAPQLHPPNKYGSAPVLSTALIWTHTIVSSNQLTCCFLISLNLVLSCKLFKSESSVFSVIPDDFILLPVDRNLELSVIVSRLCSTVILKVEEN